MIGIDKWIKEKMMDLHSRCFFFGPIISSVVALHTALARPWPAMLCLAANSLSLIVCPAIVSLLLSHWNFLKLTYFSIWFFRYTITIRNCSSVSKIVLANAHHPRELTKRTSKPRTPTGKEKLQYAELFSVSSFRNFFNFVSAGLILPSRFDPAERALSRARKGLSWANDSSAHGDRRLSQPAKMAPRTSYCFAGPIIPDSQSYSLSANTAYYPWRHTTLIKSSFVIIVQIFRKNLFNFKLMILSKAINDLFLTILLFLILYVLILLQ